MPGRDAIATTYSRQAFEVTVSLTNGRSNGWSPSSQVLLPLPPSLCLSLRCPSSYMRSVCTDAPNFQTSKQEFMKCRLLRCNHRESDPPFIDHHLSTFSSDGQSYAIPCDVPSLSTFALTEHPAKEDTPKILFKRPISIKICLNERNLVFKHRDRLWLCISNDQEQCIKKKN